MLIKILIGILIFVGALLAFNVFLVIVGLIGCVTPIKEKEYNGPKNPLIKTDGKAIVAAHRSGAMIAPENTLMAFQRCAESDDFEVELFEFDLRRSKDGKLIIVHDKTLDRTTNACEHFGETDVYVENKTYAEIRELNLGENFRDADGNYPYRGLRGKDIPENLRVVKCETVIDFIEKNSGNKDFCYIIEIKSTGKNGMKAADKLYSIITERKLQDKVIWASSRELVSVYMEHKYPDMPRSARTTEVILFYLYSRMNWNLNDIDVSYMALQIPYGKSCANNLVNLGTREFINYAHKNDIAVQYWTVNDAEDAATLAKNGADCIMSDYPQMVYEAIENCK